MSKSVTQKQISISEHDFNKALEKWEGCSPPYSGSHISTCVTAAKIILPYTGKPRRSKYESANYLRIEFTVKGKVVIYATFPKYMKLKGRKLGEFPELQLPIAREMAHEIASGGLTSDSVHSCIDAYVADLKAKVERNKLSELTFKTYLSRIKHLYLAFGEREVFSSVPYKQLVSIVDGWIETKSNNQALEMFAELRRFWKFAAPVYADGKNIAISMPDDYVSSRVQKPQPTRLFTDIESIAALWINVARCTSMHQKNALRFMILTGVRPINVSNLQWEWVSDDFSEIVYPASTIGMRGAMKTQKAFRLPCTQSLKRILEEQKQWQQEVENCNQEFVFLQPRDPGKPFSKRSLDKLIKTHAPDDAVKGIKHDGTVKGSAGAFNTMCRKFLKSNVIAQLRLKGYSRSDTREISQMCLHHSDSKADPMAEHYDFSVEILQEEMALKRIAFEAHEQSILAHVALVRRKR